LSQAKIRLGPFEVLEQVGKGASGKVWLSSLKRAQREEQLVALKVLDSRAAREERVRDAFRREVQAVAAMDHPNIVSIFDLGTVSDAAEEASGGQLASGSPYLAMAFLGGGTLKERARDMRWGGLRGCLLTVLNALAHSHARGVLHRDIKAGNILLGPRGVTLVDFGLGSELFADEAHPSLERVEGTPPYMAPEQLEARWRDYGPWTDLYSVGCLSYALISGRPPFGRNLDFTELMFSHLHHQPPPLEAPYPVPAGLQAWLYRMLAKHPRDRFQRASDAALALLSLDLVEDSEEISLSRKTRGEEDETIANAPPISDQLFPELSSDRRRVIRAELRSSLPPAGEGGRGEIMAPPLPDDWRQISDQHRADRLHGVGLGLYGLRSIPLVGREAERDQMWSALGRVRAQGRARVVVLRGSAGTGKSRLAKWLCERAHEIGAAHVLRAFHSEDGGPLDGMGPMVGRYFRCSGLSHSEAREQIRSTLGQSADLVDGELEAIAELVSSNSTQVGEDEGTVLFDRPETWYAVLERLLVRLSDDRPAVLWLDDVQWGLDALGFSQHLLDHQSTNPSPVLVVMTVRDEALLGRDVEALWLDGLLGHARTESLEIGDLDQYDRLTLVSELLGLEGEVVGEVAERTAGNPLFAVQLVGDWVQRGILVPGQRGYRLVEGAKVALPDNLHQVWSERLDEFLGGRLPSDRKALQLAAALGQAVSSVEWAAACDTQESTPSPDLISALVSRRLVRWEGTQGNWAFDNAMLRESLERAAVDAGEWEAINKRIAVMLRDTEGPMQDERLARHLLRARMDELALEPLLRSIYLRFRKGEYILAGRLLSEFDQSMDRLGLGTAEQRRGTSLLIKARIARKTADYKGAQELARQTEAVARKHGWTGLVARAQLELGNCSQDQFEPVAARELYQSALALFKELAEVPGHARALRNLGLSHCYSGNFDLARTCLEESVRLFETLDDPHGLATVIEILAGVELSTGRFEHCQRYGERSLGIARQCAAGALEGRSLLVLGDLHRYRDQPEEAEKLYREALRVFRGVGAGLTHITELHVAWSLVEQRRFDEVEPLLERCEARLTEEGRPHFVAMVHLAQLVCASEQGDWAACEHRLGLAVALLEQTGFIDMTVPRLAELAALKMAEAEQNDQARAIYLKCVDWWARLGQERQTLAAEQALRELA